VALLCWVRGSAGPGAALAGAVQQQMCAAAWPRQKRPSSQGTRGSSCYDACDACGGGGWPGTALWNGQPQLQPPGAASQWSEAFADASDMLLLGVLDGSAQRPSWRKTYESLGLPRLDRVSRHFGWLLLHVALHCRATAVTWCQVGTVQELRDAVTVLLSSDLSVVVMGRWRVHSWSLCRTHSCTAPWCGPLWAGFEACGA
jgi:hypothetical protein